MREVFSSTIKGMRWESQVLMDNDLSMVITRNAMDFIQVGTQTGTSVDTDIVSFVNKISKKKKKKS
jgi:hypothetical protein